MPWSSGSAPIAISPGTLTRVICRHLRPVHPRSLAAVHKLAMAPRPNAWGDPPYWVFAWDLEKELGLENTGRLLLAKCEALIKKKLLDGCPCGCRGDFELTRAGRALLDAPVSTSARTPEGG